MSEPEKPARKPVPKRKLEPPNLDDPRYEMSADDVEFDPPLKSPPPKPKD